MEEETTKTTTEIEESTETISIISGNRSITVSSGKSSVKELYELVKEIKEDFFDNKTRFNWLTG